MVRGVVDLVWHPLLGQSFSTGGRAQNPTTTPCNWGSPGNTMPGVGTRSEAFAPPHTTCGALKARSRGSTDVSERSCMLNHRLVCKNVTKTQFFVTRKPSWHIWWTLLTVKQAIGVAVSPTLPTIFHYSVPCPMRGVNILSVVTPIPRSCLAKLSRTPPRITRGIQRAFLACKGVFSSVVLEQAAFTDSALFGPKAQRSSGAVFHSSSDILCSGEVSAQVAPTPCPLLARKAAFSEVFSVVQSVCAVMIS